MYISIDDLIIGWSENFFFPNFHKQDGLTEVVRYINNFYIDFMYLPLTPRWLIEVKGHAASKISKNVIT